MNWRDLLPKKTVKSLTGVKVIAVRGKKETLLFYATVPLHIVGAIEIDTELVCEPVIEDVVVPIF